MSARHPDPGSRPGRIALLNAALVVLAVAALAVLAVRHGGPEVGVEVTRRDPPAGVDDLVVRVTGAVASPGAVAATPGDRIADVLQRAGGPLPDAALEGVNLGLRVRNGDTVHVPSEDEPTIALVDLNTASQADLEELPGIGPVRAAAIIEARPFRDPRDLLDRGLVSDPVWEEIRVLVAVR